MKDDLNKCKPFGVVGITYRYEGRHLMACGGRFACGGMLDLVMAGSPLAYWAETKLLTLL
jgi:hypothetical protein